jgi:RNA polymerase sigma-70 factor (ECF subfamily)
MLRPIPESRRSHPDPARRESDRRDELGALALAVQRAEPGALRTFLRMVVPHLLRVVRRVLGPGHLDLEDVTYEAAYVVVERLPEFRGQGTVLHFACRVAVFTAMNVRRRDAAQKRPRAPTGGEWAPDPDSVATAIPSPEEAAARGALAPLVRELLDGLARPMADAMALHVILGYTVGEVAEACGVPAETVRSRLRLAKQALRKRVLADPQLRRLMEDGE